MFARQMAVMKGQAWNVVETLKTPDHGPLELTRRAKVCVWDDLVDVPVAVPMRVTSSEMRRRAESEIAADRIEEEMDIGSVNASSAPAGVDLLGGSGIDATTPPADLPHPGRFEISSLVDDAESVAEPPTSSSQPNGTSIFDASTKQSHTSRPPLPRTSLSHGPPRSLNMYSPERQREHQRRFSFATAAGRRNSNSIAAQLYGAGGSSSGGGGGVFGEPHPGSRLSYDSHYGFAGDYDDELEGDLGYAAAEGMEGNQRKVIVERLEAVKSRNPVFTWC